MWLYDDTLDLQLDDPLYENIGINKKQAGT